MRELNLYKPPGVAETIDWATALGRLGATELDETMVATTLGAVSSTARTAKRVEQHGIADLVKQAVRAGPVDEGPLATAWARPRRPRCGATRPRSPSRSARSCAALGLACRPAPRTLRRALCAVGLDSARRHLLGRAGHARPSPRGHRAVRPGVRRVLRGPLGRGADRTSRPVASSRSPSTPTTTPTTTATDGAEPNDDDDDRAALLRRRGPAAQGLRRLRRRRAASGADS